MSMRLIREIERAEEDAVLAEKSALEQGEQIKKEALEEREKIFRGTVGRVKEDIIRKKEEIKMNGEVLCSKAEQEASKEVIKMIKNSMEKEKEVIRFVIDELFYGG